MSVDIKVPVLGESVTEATIGQWFKKVGDAVAADEPVVELETDKVTIEVPAPAAGVLEAISAKPGDTVNVGALIGAIGEGAGGRQARRSAAGQGRSRPSPPPRRRRRTAPAAMATAAMAASPSAQKLMAESGVVADVDGSGKRGQILKEDVLAAMAAAARRAEPRRRAGASRSRLPRRPKPQPARRPRAARAGRRRGRRARGAGPDDPPAPDHRAPPQGRAEHRRHAHHLQRGGHDARSWTLRNQYKDGFEKKHGVKLGFMGFFTKAVVHALKEIPTVNAEIDGDDIVYKNYAHIGVAVGTERGLVVPVVRNADELSIADIEKEIDRLGKLARDGKLAHGRHAGRHVHHHATAASTAR